MRAAVAWDVVDRLRLARHGARALARRGDRRRVHRHVPCSPARGRGEDGLLGHVPQSPRRPALVAGRPGHDRGACEQPVQLRRDPERLREADHRAQRALRRSPRDAVDGEQPALPRERARVRAAARLARGAAVPADLDPPLHRQRRGGSLVARGREGRRSRAGGLLRRAVAVRARADRGQPPDPRGDARPPLALPRDRDPRVAPRRRPRVPDRPRRRRARGPAAGRGLVRGGQVAGARRAADRRRVPDRLGLVVGVGDLQPQRRRRGQAERDVRLPVDARARALRRPRRGRAGLPTPRGRMGRSACRRRGSAGSSVAAASTPARSASCSR